MSRGVTFLHLADLHLGLRVTRFESDVVNRLREARFQSLENALQVAETRGVDFLLIAGDLFDDNAVSAVDAQRAFDMLKGRPTPVYVLPGNHDPYCSGSLWQRPPWSHAEGTALRVLTRAEPVEAGDGVVLLPCPVAAKRATLDPTHWIEPGETTAIRLGLAHGSLMDRAFLPPDDHPIPLDAPARGGLDYLALGHWHDMLLMESSRLAYPGAPEPTSFSEEHSGNVLLVEIAQAEMPPVITPRHVGRLRWLARTETVTEPVAERLERLRADLEALPGRADTLLRLTLTGAVSAESFPQLAEFAAWLAAAGFLQQEVRNQVRCLEELHGALQSLADRDEVIAGTAADLMRLATLDAPGGGPPSTLEARPVDELIRVWQSLEEGLRTWSAGTDVPARAEVAQEGLKLLATLAKEVEQ